MSRHHREPKPGDGASGWQRFAVIAIDNLLVLVAFLPGFLTGVATAFGATGWPLWLAPMLITAGVVLGVVMLTWNGGFLGGRGQSLGMECSNVCLIDRRGRRPVGTSRAFNYAVLSLIFNRVNGEPGFAERQTQAILVRGPFGLVLSSA